MKSRLLQGGSLLVLVVGVLYFYLGDGSDSGPAPVVDSGSASLQWRAGRFQQYDLLVDSSTAMRLDRRQPSSVMDLRMDGVLDYVTLATDRDGVLAGMRMSSMAMILAGQPAGTEVERQLTLPFRVRFALDGKVTSFEFPPEMSGDIRVIIENLVRMFQVVLRPGDAWQAEESNASGVYSADYRRVAANTLDKSKTRYLRTAPGMSGELPQVTSRETISLATGWDWIASIELEEMLLTEPAIGPAAEVSNQASLKLRGSAVIPDKGRWAFTQGESNDAGAADLRVPQLSLEDSREEIAFAISTLDLSAGVRAGHIHRLRDLLQMHPELPAMVLDVLRENALEDRTRADLYLALQLAGTPEAQSVLNQVVSDDSLPPQDGLRAIVALGSVSQPTDETLQQLWSTARAGPTDGEYRNLPATATLALGTIGKGLRISEDNNYQMLRVDLLDSASTGSTANKRAAALLALGNTGDQDPLLKNDIVPFLTDPEPKIRDAAANSLGRLGPDQVATTLVDSYQKEGSARVRGSIAKALVNWEQPSPEAVKTLRVAIEDEKDEKARYNLAVLLGNSMDTHPENRQTLEKLLETERSKRVRQEIANALYASP